MSPSTAVKPRRSAAAKPRKRASTPRRGGGWNWKALWPLALCLLITPVAIHMADILAMEGPKAFALLYPWVEVVRSPALHLPPAWVDTLAQWTIYLQFPAYGLLMTLTFRADKHLRAFIIGLIAHFGGLIAVVVLAYLA